MIAVIADDSGAAEIRGIALRLQFSAIIDNVYHKMMKQRT